MHHDDFERRKREKEFEELKHRNHEWMSRHLDEMTEFLLDLWLWRQEQKERRDKSDKNGSSLTGSPSSKSRK
jgi:hypothetical protein